MGVCCGVGAEMVGGEFNEAEIVGVDSEQSAGAWEEWREDRCEFEDEDDVEVARSICGKVVSLS